LLQDWCITPAEWANAPESEKYPRSLLKSYLPVLVFLGLGSIVGLAFTTLGRVLGPRRPSATKLSPYECGLPSDVQRGFRFGISFYLVAMLFILFDVEAIFLYPVAVQLRAAGAFVLGETFVFVALLAIAFAFVWRRGALEWK
jgi:NADH-quinone oxidoreductase subunit A